MPETDVPEPGSLRLRTYIPVTIEDRSTFALIRASIADISATDARVVTNDFFSKGSKWVLTMKAAPNLTVRAEVAWVKPVERVPGRGQQWQVGMHFLDLMADDQKRLASFLEFEQQRSATS